MANKGKLDGLEILSPAGWEALHSQPITRPEEGMTTSFTQGGINLIQPQETEDHAHPTVPGVEGFYGWMGFGGSIFQV